MLTSRSQSRRIAALVALVIALVALDQWSKSWALDALSIVNSFAEKTAVCEPEAGGYPTPRRYSHRPVELVDQVLEFRYAENCGAAFGFMNRAPAWVRKPFFYVAAAIAISILLTMFVRRRGGGAFMWSVPLIIAGAIGNLIDRVRIGYVVDFIHVHFKEVWSYPTFNVADSCITVGVVLMLLDAFLESRVRDEAPSVTAIDA